ncbi:MAG: acyl-CoA dehydrogenase family protein [Pseudorhodoplanes sp.]
MDAINTDAANVSVPLGEDYPEIREGVRAICKKYPGEYWRKLEDNDEYAEEFVKELTAAGYLAAQIPEEYGGSGLPLRAGCAILEEVNASGCHGAACHAQMYMMGMVLRNGSSEQKRKYLPGIADGTIRFQAFGVTEPTTGSDTTQLKTRAEKWGDKYIVNGQKIWTSRAHKSDLMTLLVRTTPVEQVKKRTDGLSVLLVDVKDALGKGLTMQRIDTMINHQTNALFFDNMEVPAENLIGIEGHGFRYILDSMNSERLVVASQSLGDCRFFINKAVAYSKEREVFGRPIGQNQGIQFPIARAYAEYRAADLMVRAGAALFEAGKPCGEEANIAKLLASEAAWHAAEACMQTHGGFAAAREFDVERKWRDARIGLIAPISTNLILAYIGQNVLKMPRSY